MFTAQRSCRRCITNVTTQLNSPRHASSRNDARLNPRQLNVATPLAQALKDTRVWNTKLTTRKKADLHLRDVPLKFKGDRTRVNIVSDELCDDVLSYISKSLERHQGCDLIDIYPGAGLWSRKLHDVLQPRSHILMEPDAPLYRQFLQPLLEKPGTTLVPKTGIVWNELNTILNSEYLPHQKVVDRNSEEVNKRNDTLLVSCNLAFHPKKRYLGFESITTLVLHQFIDAIRTSSLFHKYGKVRMLIWTRNEDKAAILPRLMQRRKRSAIEVELYCDWIQELVGFEGQDASWFVRDTTIDRASALATWRRMREAGINVPRQRMTKALEDAMIDDADRARIVPGENLPILPRTFHDELEQLNNADVEAGSDAHHKQRHYNWRMISDNRRSLIVHKTLTSILALSQRKEEGNITPEELRSAEAEIEQEVSNMALRARQHLDASSDNLHLWRQPKPLLMWDQRAVEPLTARLEEFYPNVACSLLDIQPGPVEPLFRDIGPGSGRAGDSFDLILKALWAAPTQPLDRTLDSLWPGAAEYIVPRCKTFHDPKQGGMNLNIRGVGLTPRLLNSEQYKDLIHRWNEWPFKPQFRELIARSQDYDEDFEATAVLQDGD